MLTRQIHREAVERYRRCEFVFTPMDGSWLNLVESFFARLTNSLVRCMRVKTKEKLKQQIERYSDRLNEDPALHTWTTRWTRSP